MTTTRALRPETTPDLITRPTSTEALSTGTGSCEAALDVAGPDEGEVEGGAEGITSPEGEAPAPKRKRRGRQRPAHPEVIRVDLMGTAMNPGKETQARALLRSWREGAALVKQEQLRLMFQEGRLDRLHRSPDEEAMAAVVGAANRLQMVRFQVVGMLRSWWSNRANDFTEVVQRSALPAETRHRLHTINRWKAWFVDPRDSKGVAQPPRMQDGSEIPPETRLLARKIMHRVLSRHRFPSTKHINAVLDRRAAPLMTWEALGGRTTFPLWVTLPGAVPGKPMRVPLVTTERFERRLREGATLLPTVQLNEVRDGRGPKGSNGQSRIVIGLTTDIGLRAQGWREAYQPRCEILALDWGLRTLFGSDQGDLLGRGFLDRLRRYDRQITELASYRQKHGLRVRSPRYDRLVRGLRGMLRSEVGRVLNRLVVTHAPAHLVLERLRFQNPNLSRRLNRILSNCGRSIIGEKLQDLQDRFGITHEEVNPAYSSQTCSNPQCGYVDHRNRQGSRFLCLLCGLKLDADVNAPRTLRSRSSRLLQGSATPHGREILRTLVARVEARHPRRSERWIGPSGRSGDPRETCRYYEASGPHPAAVRGDLQVSEARRP